MHILKVFNFSKISLKKIIENKIFEIFENYLRKGFVGGKPCHLPSESICGNGFFIICCESYVDLYPSGQIFSFYLLFQALFYREQINCSDHKLARDLVHEIEKKS